MKDHKLKATDQKTVDYLYQIMYEVTSIIEALGMTYWLQSGNLLGSVRHGGLIPWDDDLDIGMWGSDQSKMRKYLFPALENAGYFISKDSMGYKICLKKLKGNGEESWRCSFPALDIFLYKKLDDGRMVLTRKAARKEFDGEWFKYEEHFPLRRYKFGPLNILGPKEFRPYFERQYGDDWNDVGYRPYDHATGEWAGRSKLIVLKPEDRKPALPKRNPVKKSFSARLRKLNNDNRK